MPFTIPSLAECRGFSRDAVIEALRVDGLPGNAPAAILADDNGALSSLIYQYIQRMALEFLPDKAGEQMLQRWSDIFLTGGRKAATYAVLAATLSGPAGTPVPQATQFSVGGMLLQTTADATLGGTDVATTLGVRALTAGTVGNLPANTALSLVAAISGVTASATVTGITSYGVDLETLTAWRNRILFRIQQPPMGGAAHDYEAWALEVPGVTRAWAAPHEVALGTMTVRVMCDDLRASTGGYPLQSDLDAVAAHIAQVRPVTVSDIYVLPPVPQPIDVTIGDLTPDTPSTRAAVIASIQAMLQSRAAPAHAVNGVMQPAQTIYAAWMSEAISAAEGVDHFDLAFFDAVMPNNGCMATLGAVAFV